ncbi:hypothetical protein F5Y19DRAFT_469188 [Xylariaceae sp. FL1651]|nr:hypothetical protein F5Y19DRAFT_469188 [Xylariaceae sp. FL1651]
MARSESVMYAEPSGLSKEAGTYIDGNVEITEDWNDWFFERQTARQPDVPLVYSWDVDSTYIELDRAANRLAHYLQEQFKIIPGSLIHILRDDRLARCDYIGHRQSRCSWGFSNPSHTQQRKQQIVQQTRATLALAFAASSSTRAALGLHLIQVGRLFDAQLIAEGTECYHTPPHIDLPALDVTHVLFTSGLTGICKGIII